MAIGIPYKGFKRIYIIQHVHTYSRQNFVYLKFKVNDIGLNLTEHEKHLETTTTTTTK